MKMAKAHMRRTKIRPSSRARVTKKTTSHKRIPAGRKVHTSIGMETIGGLMSASVAICGMMMIFYGLITNTASTVMHAASAISILALLALILFMQRLYGAKSSKRMRRI